MENLRALLRLLDQLDEWLGLVAVDPGEGAFQVQPGSPLAGDDRVSYPYHVSHRAWLGVSVAVDYLHCLRNSLLGEQQENRQHVRLHPFAQLSLVRGAIENAAGVVWLLGPGRRPERVRNRLALEWMETQPRQRIHELMGHTPKRTRDERRADLVRMLVSAGWKPDGQGDPTKAAKAELNGLRYSNVVREAGEHTSMGANAMETIWVVCSGVAHGDVHKILGTLEREGVRPMAPGVTLHRLSADVQLLFFMVYGTCQMLSKAFSLFRARARSPW